MKNNTMEREDDYFAFAKVVGVTEEEAQALLETIKRLSSYNPKTSDYDPKELLLSLEESKAPRIDVEKASENMREFIAKAKAKRN